nr:hypothetical protein [Vicinamibacterales bacterium]
MSHPFLSSEICGIANIPWFARTSEQHQRVFDALREAEERLSSSVFGHGLPCYYCGELCSALAGDPGKWPIGLCHKNQPGRVWPHHVSCVSERLARLDAAEHAVLSANNRITWLRDVISAAADGS